MDSSSPSEIPGPSSKPRKASFLDRWALRVAQALLRWRVGRQWRELEHHIDNCPRRQCQWWKKNGVPEDQHGSMFCREGEKLWSRNFDMSCTAETLD
jgi:hypothetical protein